MPVDLSRREFLMLSAAAASNIAFDKAPRDKEQRNTTKLVGNTLLITTWEIKNYIPHNYLVSYNLETHHLQKIPIPLRWSHAICTQAHSSTMAISEFSGSGGVVFDYHTPKSFRKFYPAPGYATSGHAILDDNGHLFTSEYSLSDYTKGRIVIRDLSTLKVVNVINSGGTHPHDMRWHPNKKWLYVCNYGELPKTNPVDLSGSLTLLNPMDGKVIDKHPCPSPDERVCHLDVSDQGEVVMIASNFLKNKSPDATKEMEFCFQPKRVLGPDWKGDCGWHALSSKARFLTKNNKIIESAPNEIIKRMKGPFSAAVNNPMRQAAITYRMDTIVGFWSLNDFSFLGYADLKNDSPTGVFSTDGGASYAVSSLKGNLYHVDAKTFKARIDRHLPRGLLRKNMHLELVTL